MLNAEYSVGGNDSGIDGTSALHASVESGDSGSNHSNTLPEPGKKRPTGRAKVRQSVARVPVNSVCGLRFSDTSYLWFFFLVRCTMLIGHCVIYKIPGKHYTNIPLLLLYHCCDGAHA